MSFTGDYQNEVLDGFVDSYCYIDESGTLEVVLCLEESWPFSLIMTVPGVDGADSFSGTWEAGGYGEESELTSTGPVDIDVDVLDDEDWARIAFSGSFSGDMGSAESREHFACSFGA